jgi:hypothetical protein
MTDQAAAVSETKHDEIKKSTKEIWLRAWLVLNERLAHTGVLASLIVLISLLELVVEAVSHGQDHMFFEHTPFAYAPHRSLRCARAAPHAAPIRPSIGKIHPDRLSRSSDMPR